MSKPGKDTDLADAANENSMPDEDAAMDAMDFPGNANGDFDGNAPGDTDEEPSEAIDEAADEAEAPDPLQVAQAEAADLKDRLLRAVAETANLRRRSERERDDLRKYAVSDFARDMLAVSDNLRRALDTVPDDARKESEALTNLLEGVDLTERELLSKLEKHGIKKVDPLGEKLDPNLHQAMAQIDHPDAEAGTVIQVLQVGYVIHGRLLRPAMVAIAKGNGTKDNDANGDDANGNGAEGNDTKVDTKA